MKRAAVFFDRDNTLIANDGYLGDPRGVELVQGAADAVARARALGYAVVVFSNQSGVARGMFSEEAVHAVNHRMDEMLLDENGHAVIDRHEFCPFHPQATQERYRQDSDLRKPRPGMILQAERLLALDLSRSWVVGDAPRDTEAGHVAGCRTILVNNPSLTKSPAAEQEQTIKPDFEVESLAEAMEVIARHHAQKPAPAEQTSEPPPAIAITAEPAPSGSHGSTVATQPDAPREEKNILETAETIEKPAEPKISEPKVEHVDPPAIPRGRSKSEILLGQILDELRRRHEHPEHDFSVSKLIAGIVQVLALAAMFYAYVERNSSTGSAGLSILTAIFLQTFTIALLIMGKQK